MRLLAHQTATMLLVLATACGGSASPGDADAGGGPGPGDPDAGDLPPGTPDAGDPQPGDPDAAPVDTTVADLLALVQGCGQVIGGTYSTDFGDPSNINVCGLSGAVYWKSDFDIDCDGKRTAVCNEQTDGAYQPRTSAQDANGDPLDASQLPYFVIPLPSNRWDYGSSGIDLGQIAAVIYNGKLEYAVFGDQGPNQIIGEASYKLAQLLGINPDPSNGGTEGPVYFIVFTGASGRIQTIEDHAAAIEVGKARVAELLQAN